jgi:hypothetical protein
MTTRAQRYDDLKARILTTNLHGGGLRNILFDLLRELEQYALQVNDNKPNS